MRKSENQEQSPAFQFYAGDWISDPNRLKMSLDEQGAYVLLYCHCWRGKSIEFDWEILSRLCNCRLDKIKKIWPKIEHLFDKKKNDKTGKVELICLSAEEERKEQEKNRKLKQKAGRLGAKVRWSSEGLKEDDNESNRNKRS